MSTPSEALAEIRERLGEIQSIAGDQHIGWELSVIKMHRRVGDIFALLDSLETVEGYVVYGPEQLRELVATDSHFRVYGRGAVDDLPALLLTLKADR